MNKSIRNTFRPFFVYNKLGFYSSVTSETGLNLLHTFQFLSLFVTMNNKYLKNYYFLLKNKVFHTRKMTDKTNFHCNLTQ